jgi:hypothetical protein
VPSLAPGASGSLTAVCPTGFVVIAGGFAGTPGATQAYQSRPVNSLVNGPDDSWRAAYVNPSNSTVSGGFTTYAVCVPD